MTDRELMQQALEALVRMHSYGDVFRYQKWQSNPHEQVSDVIAALRERLAQPEQEPVAYGYRDARGNIRPLNHYETKMNRIPLYTAPPQRKPLTDEEIALISVECAASHQHDDVQFARAVIAKATGEKE